MDADKIVPPWDAETVAALNRFQADGRFHPFTCPHEHGRDATRVLRATAEGWVCEACGCKQAWAWAMMAKA